MKKVRVNVGKVGVIKKNGDYKRVLSAGSYWIGFNETVFTYEMSAVYKSTMDLNIMLQDPAFQKLTQVIEVKDNEIAFKYVGENFDSVLNPGRYFVWKGYMDFRFKVIDVSDVNISEDVNLSTLNLPLVKPFVRQLVVEAHEEGLLFINGSLVKKVSQGTYYFWKNAMSIDVLKADLRQTPLEISGQEMLTKDKAALRINFFAQYQVVNVERALLNSKDFERQLYLSIQLVLREFIGTLTLDEILDNKEKVSDYVLKCLKSNNQKLGVELTTAGIRDIILPGEIKEIMNQVLVASKQAQANTIARREETAATRNLLNTAKLMEDNEMLYKLKEMEYVEKIAGKVGEISLSGGDQIMTQLTKVFAK